MKGTIVGVCTSPKRGTVKKNIHHARIVEGWGIENDAHGGDWHRQISLLSYDRVKEFNARGAAVEDGAFGENLLIEGIDCAKLPVGTHLRCGEIELEVTQIGKECHTHCEIYHRMGECIMPRQGIFTKVIHGGEIKEGDEIVVMEE